MIRLWCDRILGPALFGAMLWLGVRGSRFSMFLAGMLFTVILDRAIESWGRRKAPTKP